MSPPRYPSSSPRRSRLGGQEVAVSGEPQSSAAASPSPPRPGALASRLPVLPDSPQK